MRKLLNIGVVINAIPSTGDGVTLDRGTSARETVMDLACRPGYDIVTTLLPCLMESTASAVL
jgi:hypothetical protein